MIKSALAITGLFILSLAAHATPVGLGAAAGYNVFTFGDLYATSDIAGRVAVGGNLTSNLRVGGSSEYGSFPSAYVFVDLAHGNGSYQVTANSGGYVYVPSYDGSNGQIQIQNGTPSGVLTGANPLDFASAERDLTRLSASISSLKATSTGQVSGNRSSGFALTANSAVTVFNLTAEQFVNVKTITTNGNTVIVNVSGTGGENGIQYNPPDNLFIDNVQATAKSTAASMVLFNFKDATQIDLTRNLYGTILAPEATLTGNGQFNGQIIVDSLRYQGEIHGTPFGGTIPASVPEPASLALLGSGMAGMLALKRKVLRR